MYLKCDTLSVTILGAAVGASCLLILIIVIVIIIKCCREKTHNRRPPSTSDVNSISGTKAYADVIDNNDDYMISKPSGNENINDEYDNNVPHKTHEERQSNIYEIPNFSTM